MFQTLNRPYTFLVILVFLWCAGFTAVPLLRHAGHANAAGILYSFYGRVCHQTDARCFHADGEKFGVCIRCSAIYFGFLAGLIAWPMLRGLRRTQPPPAKFFAAAVLPMILDVLLQLCGIHASTTVTRVWSGAWFGIAMPWWIVPLFIDGWHKIFHRTDTLSPDPGASHA